MGREPPAETGLLQSGVRSSGLDSPTVVFDAQMEQQLRDAIDEWREILGLQVAQARQIVTKLLAEKPVAGAVPGLS